MSKITKPWKIAEKNRKKGQNRSSSRQSHPFLAQDPDAVVGQFHDLPVENFSDYGVYLSLAGTGCFCPTNTYPKILPKAAKIRVFIYTDSEDRPVATTLAPAGVVGDIVALKVKDTAAFGVFMDWGLEKDLLIPRSEQQGRMVPGETHLVKLFLDKSSHRVFGSTLMEKLCLGDARSLAAGEAVDLIIHSISSIGYTAVINQTCLGMLYKSETFENLAIGDRFRDMS